MRNLEEVKVHSVVDSLKVIDRGLSQTTMAKDSLNKDIRLKVVRVNGL